MKVIKKQIYLLYILVLLWGCDQAEQESPTIDIAAPVSVMEIGRGNLSNHTVATGNAMAGKVLEVSTQIGGTFILKNNPTYKRPYKLGDRVKAGQLFVEIEDEEYVNGIDLESTKMNLDIAKQDYEKQKSVYDKGGVTLRELRNAELQLTQAKTNLESAEIKLEKMKIFIPISGVITKITDQTSNSLIQQGTALATIMDYSNMYLDVNLPENTMVDIKKGQRVQLTNYNLPNDTIIGTISEISPAIDVETRTFLGKIRFNNSKLLVRPGMFVKALIKVNQKNNVLIIPKEVIISDQTGKRVFVVQENTAFERIIETGMESDNMIEVVSGLEENERLVVKGFETLRNKSKVKVLQ